MQLLQGVVLQQSIGGTLDATRMAKAVDKGTGECGLTGTQVAFKVDDQRRFDRLRQRGSKPGHGRFTKRTDAAGCIALTGHGLS